MSREEASAELLRFLESTYDAPEVLWCAGLAMIERATVDGKEARWGRFRSHPRGQLRVFRRDVAAGMRLLRLAVNLRLAADERDRELNEELHRAAVEAGRRARRAQTLPAQRARLAKAAARKAAGQV